MQLKDFISEKEFKELEKYASKLILEIKEMTMEEFEKKAWSEDCDELEGLEQIVFVHMLDYLQALKDNPRRQKEFRTCFRKAIAIVMDREEMSGGLVTYYNDVSFLILEEIYEIKLEHLIDQMRRLSEAVLDDIIERAIYDMDYDERYALEISSFLLTPARTFEEALAKHKIEAKYFSAQTAHDVCLALKNLGPYDLCYEKVKAEMHRLKEQRK